MHGCASPHRPDVVEVPIVSPSAGARIPPALRAFDLAMVVLALPLALVAGAVIAVAVWLDSPGPVIYRSRRIGRGGRPFTMLKFRTMARDAQGPPLSARGDERHTPLGRHLTQSRLDELPQLWNVLRGEMRLVGPRPEVEEFVRDFPAEYERILSVPPGLTGPVQVEYAWEGEILARAQEADRTMVYRESILPFKLAIDLRYVECHSVRGDLVLLARTAALPAVRLWRQAAPALAPHGVVRWDRVAPALVLLASVIVLAGLLAAEAGSPV